MHTHRLSGAVAMWLALAGVPLGCRYRDSSSRSVADASGAPLVSGVASMTPADLARGVPCGAMHCRAFDTALDAMRVAIDDRPLIIGLGEAHAPRSAGRVPSSAKRFAESILPLFQGRASDILVELMLSPRGCARASKNVQEAQRPVTEKQSDADQSDYVAIGDAARQLGIVPDLLRPSCADLDAIAAAGAEAVGTSLETIKRLIVSQVRALLARPDRDPSECIVIYGGALHDDPSPPPERARWSYAPELSAAVGGRYVAIDLFVPEFIRDDATWRAFDWFPYYDRASHPNKATMLGPGQNKYVIFFPAFE